uniref:Uncharacterized protein n=1 Tax=Cryptomonas curvata TaxID=233186 RepID=A0A7S0QVI7_9CRYP|mmetsp:Transcript_54505/g.113831  ORF Transcript_54505/g.113831 Transcript_54505/m.113831 type:complete len:388 (+) Transcript_54505:73-1236(+)
MVFRARIVLWGVQVPVQNTCSFARNVRLAGHKYDDRRRFLSCAHRPSPTSLFSKNLTCIPHIYIRPGSRSKSTLSLGRVGGRGGQDNLGVWTTITLWQSGMRRPQPVEISHDARTIRGDEKTLQALHKSLQTSVPEVWTTLDDRGNHLLHWPAGTDSAVNKYLDLYRATAENTYLYEGAFATGVRRVKVLSLGTLLLSVTAGPVLLASGSVLQGVMGAAVMAFGTAATAAAHMVTTPYVLSLRRLADGSFQAETALITGTIKQTHFTRHEVLPSSRPFCTFSAKGHYFYVHKELFVGDDAQAMLCDLLGDAAAEQMYEEQLRKNPGDLDALFNYGRFLWKVRGDLEAAEVAFTKILAEDPSDREALAVLKAVQALKPAPPAAADPPP